MLNHSFIKYGFVGIFSALIDYSLLFILHSFLNVSVDFSVTIAFFGSSFFNFLMHKKYTFNSNGKVHHELLRYIVLIGLSYFITIYLINYIISYGVNLYLAKLITLFIVYIYGYLFSKIFVYKNSMIKSEKED